MPHMTLRLEILQVRSLRLPHSLVQTLPLRGMTMLTSAPAGNALVANDKTVYRLQPMDVAAQVRSAQKVRCGFASLAVKVLESIQLLECSVEEVYS